MIVVLVYRVGVVAACCATWLDDIGVDWCFVGFIGIGVILGDICGHWCAAV